jgi:indolepyruvate ferredoxin oxidoreductase, beta subunit
MNTSTSTEPFVVAGALPVPKLITIAILAMGGEGGGVLSDWIVDLAEHAGYHAQTTSVPGVAQRTGATIYYLEIFPGLLADLAGKEPVLALMPVPGEVDVVIASELMEAGRAIQRGLVTPDRTTLIASTHRVYSMTERTAMADGRANPGSFIDASADSAKVFVSADFAKIADRAGTVISAALFGGLAGTDVLPFGRAQFEEAIRRGGIGIDASLKAFSAGYETVRHQQADSDKRAEPRTAYRVGPLLKELAERVQTAFPFESHEILFPAIQRLAEYQDLRYASEYLDKLEPIRNLDREFGDGQFGLLRETGRYLALWLSYEDAIRVADLKTRSGRFDRVNRETRVGSAQLIEINEFLSPQPQEIADLLPVSAGRWLMGSRWAKSLILRFTGGGKVVKTTSLHGFIMLYLIAHLRPLRRRSLRFHVEQEETATWLDAIASVATQDYALAEEVAECGQLIKGYGDTHDLGTRNFHAILKHLPSIRGNPMAAEELKQLRKAALADDTGSALAKALGGDTR